MTRKRRRRCAEVGAKVALEALLRDLTVTEPVAQLVGGIRR
ncbi:MAG: hypothetical protein R6V44_04120 [Paracoccaceae bacterium]